MKSSWLSQVPGFRSLSPAGRQILLAAVSLLGLILLAFHAATTGNKENQTAPAATSNAPGTATTLPVPVDVKTDVLKEARIAPMPPVAYDAHSGEVAGVAGGPRITYSAELSVVTKEFAHARSSMEDVLERHRGYTAKLRMVGQPSGSTLAATLRVPATEYRGALAELKGLGDVERDEEAADEIAQLHGDLEARLQNAQNNERRLQQWLKDSSDKGAALAPIEQQLSVLRGEIGRLEEERRAYDDRAVFSNIYLTMREEKVAPAVTFGAELRSAAISGLSDAFHALSAILLFCVNYGPSLLLWAAFLYFPTRMLWRRFRPANPAPTPASA
ncbi:MAG TPA: DUF4349 domain-containing protein [Candidatus Acidoferrum sp.]|nr:DUF4349 domain-containing protein [Candidatus Acidoferrum sp.]